MKQRKTTPTGFRRKTSTTSLPVHTERIILLTAHVEASSDSLENMKSNPNLHFYALNQARCTEGSILMACCVTLKAESFIQADLFPTLGKKPMDIPEWKFRDPGRVLRSTVPSMQSTNSKPIRI